MRKEDFDMSFLPEFEDLIKGKENVEEVEEKPIQEGDTENPV